MSQSLILASRNPGKIRELKALLAGLPLEIKSLADFPQIPEILEDGKTFEENARIKARAVHRVTGGIVLADDSGLECEDLGGAPGVHSARYAGPNATDTENNHLLLEDLSYIHDPCRVARYVCVLVLLEPDGHETLLRETCAGLITFTSGGKGGFGYDPYFFLPDRKCTMAELPLEVKNQISHRGKALKKIVAYLSRKVS